MKKVSLLLAIFLLAFSIRIFYAVNCQKPIESDEKEYSRLAISLANTGEYVDSEGRPTSYRPPVYPFFLSIIYKVFGQNLLAVRVIQSLLGALTACLFFSIAYSAFNNFVVAGFSGLFSSFYMPFVACANLLYAETLFTFEIALIVLIIMNLKTADKLLSGALGILCGSATLTKGTALFLPFLAIIFLEWKFRKAFIKPKERIFSYLTLLLCFGLVMTPWTLRNYKVHKRFVPVSTNSGLNLYQGVSWSEKRIFHPGFEGEKIWDEVRKVSNEPARSDIFKNEAIKIYKGHPFFAAKMALMRFLFFWGFIDWEITGADVINYHYVFLMPFFILGIIYGMAQKTNISFFILIILYFTSFTLLFPGTPRYRMPIDGYIIIVGSFGIREFIRRGKNKTIPILTAGCYFIFTYALYKYSLETKFLLKSALKKIGLW